VAEIREELAPGTPVEVWFQDEMRVGQKNKLTYRWARKGARPRAIHDQRTQSTYLFGAVCPERGAGAALVLPACNAEAMQLHLDEIATKVIPGAHAIVILDQAGWHGAKDLEVPSNISLLRCRRAPPSSTAKKTSGSSCGRTGCRTDSSNPSTISSTTAATPGTRSSISHGKSGQSPTAIGQP
jgi:DDE superfamily endonuclease